MRAVSPIAAFWTAFSLSAVALAGLMLLGLGAGPVYDDLDLIERAAKSEFWAFALSALPFDPNYWRPLPMSLLWGAERAGPWARWALSTVIAWGICAALCSEAWRGAREAGWGSPLGGAVLGVLPVALAAHPSVSGLWSWQSAIFDLLLCLGLLLGWKTLRATRDASSWVSGLTAMAVVALCGLCKEAPLPIAGVTLAAIFAWPRKQGRRPALLGAAMGAMLLLAGRWAALGYLTAPLAPQPSAIGWAPEAFAGYLASLAGVGSPAWASAYGPAPIGMFMGALLGAVALFWAWREGGALRILSVAIIGQALIMCLALHSGLISGDAHYAARHMAFAPLILCAAAMPKISLWARSARGARLLACAVLFAAWGILGAKESLFWRSSDQFWSQALILAPESPVAAGWRVGELKRSGQFEQARAVCEETLPAAARGPASAPATGLAYFCAALALERSRNDDARRIAVMFKGSWERAPELAYLAGLAALRQNDSEGAQAALSQALVILRGMPAVNKGAERQAIEAKLSSVLKHR